MLEWEVLEEEAALPAAAPMARARRWGQWVVLLLALALMIGGALAWQVRQQRQRLHAELQVVLDSEARLMALGQWEPARDLLDPAAPLEWKNAYLYYLSRPQPVPGTPTIRSVVLAEEGTRATVRAAWPAAAGAAPIIETRAYRMVQGQWRRTPLFAQDTELTEVATDHIVLRGEPTELVTLREPEWRFDPFGLRAHLAASWPQGWVEPRPVTVVVRRREFGELVTPSRSRRTLLLNSPRLNYTLTSDPLPPDAWYRLQTTDALLLKLLPVQQPPASWSEAERERALTFQRQLHWAEARWWALSDSERAALHEQWRAALGAQWPSPLDPAATLDEEARWMAMNLLLDDLVAQHGTALLGALAQHFDAHLRAPNAAADAIPATFVGATGISLERLGALGR